MNLHSLISSLLLLFALLVSVAGHAAQAGQAANTVTDYLGNEIELTEISLDQAGQIFDGLLADKNIPWDYKPSGCEAKAHKIALTLNDLEIVSAKAFVEGSIFWSNSVWWQFHVAAMVAVREGDTTHLYILDPVAARQPVRYLAWMKRLKRDSRTRIQENYFTPQYNYSPCEKARVINTFEQYYIDDMETVFHNIRRNQDFPRRRGFMCM